MKTEVLAMEMGIKQTGLGVKVRFSSEIKGHMAQIISDEQEEMISEHLSAISEIMNEALDADIRKEFEEFLEEKEEEKKHEEVKKKLYDAMPEDAKKEIDEYERKMASFETDEERAEYAFSKVMGALDSLKDMLGEI